MLVLETSGLLQGDWARVKPTHVGDTSVGVAPHRGTTDPQATLRYSWAERRVPIIMPQNVNKAPSQHNPGDAEEK